VAASASAPTLGGALPTFGLGEGLVGGVDLLGSSLLTGSAGIGEVGGALAAGAGGAAAGDAAKAALYSDYGYGAGMTGAQTTAFDTLLNATGSTTLAKIGSDLAGVLDVIPGVKDFVEGSSLFNSGGGGLNLRDLLGLFGAGMQQWNIEKVAKDQRDWIDSKETAARKRRAPVRGTAGVLRVVGG
jgi:hypothetical protein